MLSNDELQKSVVTQSPSNGCPTKTVTYSKTHSTTISPRPVLSNPPAKSSYESMFKEYLKKMNGASTPKATTDSSPPQTPPATATSIPGPLPVAPGHETDEDDPLQQEIKQEPEDEEDEAMEVETLDDEPPKRKRGRPRGSGRLKNYYTVPIRDYEPPKPAPVTPRRRGWPLGLSRKKYVTYKTPSPPKKRGPGRPRKIVAFGYHTILSEIKTVCLPSEMWSANVSVTAKKSHVSFKRTVEGDGNNLECDRCVNFNGTVNYVVCINNKEVSLLAAPICVSSISDVEILLQIVDEIGIEDPILEYFSR